jgi:hypothetical protein
MGTNKKNYQFIFMLFAFQIFTPISAEGQDDTLINNMLPDGILASKPQDIYSDTTREELGRKLPSFDLILGSKEKEEIINQFNYKEDSFFGENSLYSKELSEGINEFAFIRFEDINQPFLIDGTIIINFKNFPNENVFASKYNLVFKSSFISINSASFKVKKLSDLENIIINLQDDTNINRLTIDYKDHRLAQE